ncbi:unnamed protein product, partial [Prorocentrum cordatum]
SSDLIGAHRDQRTRASSCFDGLARLARESPRAVAVAEAVRTAASGPAGPRQSHCLVATFEGVLHNAGRAMAAGREAESEVARKALLGSGLDSGRELAKRWAAARGGRRAQAHPGPQLAFEISEALEVVAGPESVGAGGCGESSDGAPISPRARLAQTAVETEAGQEKLDEKGRRVGAPRRKVPGAPGG